MTEPAGLSPLKRALVAIETLQARLDAAERARTEPIAVVGVGCRMPGGVRGPGEFWASLRAGADLVSEVPADRWDVEAYHDPDQSAPGTMSTRRGGFLDQVDEFDPGFFALSLGEASSMDPQQRLLLEVAWEALEHAGQPPSDLAGTHTDVYVGISTWDYSLVLGGAPIRGLSGTAFSIAANRLSYVFDLHGASVAIDTACSSSLVAVHLACQSLRAGTARLALAGGVNVMLWPETTAAFSQIGMLSPDGRCRTFDARANGYVRGEGAGLVVLKRLSDAEADGDRVLAVIRGSAVNQDGRSNGLTAPNGVAQRAVIEAALAAARVRPSDVDYVEAHGTGTALGDPVEVNALGATFGADRAEPLLLGSVKTNVGHLEAAAGVTGLIKVALGLHHGEIPPHLHFTEPNPHADWDVLPLRVPTERTAWPSPAGHRVAGVSSFGFGGTNAHVVLGDAPARRARPAAEERPRLLTVSARTDSTLRTLAASWADRLDAVDTADTADPVDLADLCHTTTARRTHFAHRAALPVTTLDEARAALRAIAAGEPLHHGVVPADGRRRVAFVFPGQGGQHVGMARELYRTQPVFRREIDRCAELFDAHHPWRLLDVLYPEGAGHPIDETEFAQPALFAIQYALAALWRSWGVAPDAVLGHSLGEYAAACVAGVFGLETGVRLIVERGRLTRALPPNGMMAACSASADLVTEAITEVTAERGGLVAVAAVNGPEHTVISGEKAAVTAVLEHLEADFVLTRPLRVSYASHSPLLDPILDEFEAAIAWHAFAEPTVPFVSTLTGSRLAPGTRQDAGYWRRQLREPVRFLDAMRALAADGYDTFLELGPKDTLTEMGKRCLPKGTGLWLPSLHPDSGNWSTLLTCLAELHTHGVDVDWTAVEGAVREPVDLPTYPFERRRCWLAPEQVAQFRRHVGV